MRHGFATGNLGRHLFYLTYHARSLANHFTNLKIARETTDYDPNRILTAGAANYWIREARVALSALRAMTAADRQTFRNITLTGNP